MPETGDDARIRIQIRKTLGMMLQMMPGYSGKTPEETERI
jgi:hypothetical protein